MHRRSRAGIIDFSSSSKESAINEAIETYLETKLKAESEKIPIAPMEIVEKK